MNVYWLEQTEADLPNGATGVPPVPEHGRDGRGTPQALTHGWLGARELVQLGGLRFAKRRADWQLGRWTAKLAVAACLQLPADLPSLAKIEVRAAPSGAPEIFLGNKWAPVTISLTHREGRAVCAVAPCRGALGCDLEAIEPHSEAFVADYFAAEEQALVARVAPPDRPWLVTLLWSAKESALKALQAGLRLDTRRVIVTLGDGIVGTQKEYTQNADFAAREPGPANVWRPLSVRHINDQTFPGWWQHNGSLLRTMVAAPPPACPLSLDTPYSSTRSPSVAGSDQSQVA